MKRWGWFGKRPSSSKSLWNDVGGREQQEQQDDDDWLSDDWISSVSSGSFSFSLDDDDDEEDDYEKANNSGDYPTIVELAANDSSDEFCDSWIREVAAVAA